MTETMQQPTVKRKGGWTELPMEEKKKQVFGYVKAKHWKEAQKELTELLKKYR